MQDGDSARLLESFDIVNFFESRSLNSECIHLVPHMARCWNLVMVIGTLHCYLVLLVTHVLILYKVLENTQGSHIGFLSFTPHHLYSQEVHPDR